MGCFYSFRDKIRTRVRRSAPELRIPVSKSDNPVSNSDNFGSNSAGQVPTSCASSVSARSINELYEEKARDLRVFSLSELRRATNGFDRLLKVGEGGFGIVYKGTVKPVNGQGEPLVVAIKKLRNDGYQGHKQWLAEVQFLSVVEHSNLVKLVGYCAVDGERGIQRLLVYEYMPNRSLEDHLFNKAYPALSWEKRLQIIYGAARGLAYLHEELEVQVIFRDFKTSNVLLDKDFQPKLSDFGLAREGPMPGHTHVSTAVVGTHGYAAPDYIATGHLNAKSDVWSFGVVLYEILTGRKSLERGLPRTEQKLLDWVKQFPADGKRFGTIMDPRLQGQYSVAEARRIAKLADSCLLKSPKARPMMSQVVEQLKQIVQTPKGASPDEISSDAVEDDSIDPDNNDLNQDDVSERAERRLAHLAKLSEHVDGFSKRKFLILQRAKVG
ncbi:Probable serine/threonine-protein kinase pbl19 [Dionaea muscipula]